MKMSLIAGEPGYIAVEERIPPAVLLDGKLMQFAIRADEEEGYVDVAIVPAGEALIFSMITADSPMRRMTGTVKIRNVGVR